jgi:hypothetical protein
VAISAKCVKQSSSGGGVGGGGVPIVVSSCVKTCLQNVEDLVRATVNSNVCRFARALQLLVIMIHKCPTRLSIQSNYPTSDTNCRVSSH